MNDMRNSKGSNALRYEQNPNGEGDRESPSESPPFSGFVYLV
jgi:hypothetical protein